MSDLAGDAAVHARHLAPQLHASRDLQPALALAQDLGGRAPQPGAGDTAELWRLLTELGRGDLTIARIVEPHLDALAIIDQAQGLPGAATLDRAGTWGVFAAEGPGMRLSAIRDGDSWRLTGRKPWCSLARHLDRALVTAWVSDDERGLFAIDLHDPGVRPVEGGWASHGLSLVTSGPIDCADVLGVPVGPPQWYLSRPGFAWGGIGVAAIWLGGALGLADRMLAASRTRPPDQLALMHLGAVETALFAAQSSLDAAAAQIDAAQRAAAQRAATQRDAAQREDAHDDGTSRGTKETISSQRFSAGSTAQGSADDAWAAGLALRVRAAVAQACEHVLSHADHALGPGPLTAEPEHARRVADLRIYLRQWHAERDLAALGKLVATAPTDV